MESLSEYSSLKSVLRVTFNDRRLQFTEKEQLQVWKTERHPTEKLIELDIPLCYGIVSCATTDNATCSLTTVEFFWDRHQRATVVGIRLNCVSTEFTARKCGGERGIPLRIQLDTYGLIRDSTQESMSEKLLHCAYCLVKVFKPKGAERKFRNDLESYNRLSPENQKSCRPSLPKTVLIEMSDEDIRRQQNQNMNSMSLSSSLLQNPHVSTTILNSSNFRTESSSEIKPQFSRNFDLSEDMTPKDVSQWMRLNQFDVFINTLNKYSAGDLLCLSRQDFIDICGVAEGIRFSNAVHRKPVRPKLTLYVSSHCVDCESDYCRPNLDDRMKSSGSIDSFNLSSACSLSSASSSGSVLNRTSTTISGSLCSSLGSCFGSTVDIRTVVGSTPTQSTRKRKIDSVDDESYKRSKRGCCHRDVATKNVFDLVNLDYLTRNHLVERLSVLHGLQSNRISDIYLQTVKGLMVEVTDLVVEHFENESYYQLDIKQAVDELQPVAILLLKSVANTRHTISEVQL